MNDYGLSMDTLERDGAEIAFAAVGSGPDILFVHNGGTSSTIWRHQVAALSERSRTIIVDLPGFGCTTRSCSGADWPTQVSLLAAVLDELEVDRVLVVGNCMGSNLSVGLAEARPRAVRGLVLVNPLTEATFTDGWLGTLHWMSRYDPWFTGVVRRIARRIAPRRASAVAALRLQLGDKGVALGLHHDEELLAANLRSHQMPALIDVLDDMHAYGGLDREPSFRKLPPICTIWGAQNRVLCPRAGERLNEALGVERAEVLEGCGHLPMLEDPAAVTAIIDSFAQAIRFGTARSMIAPASTPNGSVPKTSPQPADKRLAQKASATAG